MKPILKFSLFNASKDNCQWRYFNYLRKNTNHPLEERRLGIDGIPESISWKNYTDYLFDKFQQKGASKLGVSFYVGQNLRARFNRVELTRNKK